MVLVPREAIERQEEPGADVVRNLLIDGIVTAANWSEVLQKAQQHGRDANEVAILLQATAESEWKLFEDDIEIELIR